MTPTWVPTPVRDADRECPFCDTLLEKFDCEVCDGDGVLESDVGPDGDYNLLCPDCDGTGYILGCAECGFVRYADD